MVALEGLLARSDERTDTSSLDAPAAPPRRGSQIARKGKVRKGGVKQVQAKLARVSLRGVEPVVDRSAPTSGSRLPRADLRSLTTALTANPKSHQHVVHRVRSRLVHIHALPATHVPTPSQVQAALGHSRLQQYAELMPERRTAHVLAALSTQLPRPGQTLSAVVDSPNVRDNELHDAYFCVVRVDPRNMASHVEGIILAAQTLRCEMRSGSDRLGIADFGEIADGIELAFTLATGIRSPRIAMLRTVHRAALSEAMIARRWMRGHQLFLVITQAMIASLNNLEVIVGHGGDDSEMAGAIEQLVRLLRAAAGSMRLTGDFPPDIYDTTIRPSMAPPELPDGFSGIFSSDHRFLVTRLREITPRFSGLKERLHDAHALLVKAFADLYDDHINVCANFVSSEKNSLLMADGARCTALEQLGKFKKSRLRLLGRP